MKKVLIVLAVVLFTVGFASEVSAQIKLTDNTAGGEILTPISLTRGTQLEFGKLAVLAGGGSVSISADGANTVTKSDDVTLVPGVSRTAATYTVQGNVGSNYSISAPTSIIVTNGTDFMTIVTSVLSASTTSSDGGTLNATTGSDNFYIGGTLTIDPGQASGSYSKTFDVTVNYN